MPQSHSAQASATAVSSASWSAMTPGRREACSGWLTATRGGAGGQTHPGSSSMGGSGVGGKKVYHHSRHHL
ncbi:uncharacterized protein PG998_014046 [Apiospora kogelbergensis]|uniref:Uncharacterized protein n=1 Tax=Apiospora kogelbergensis TaxID=1337665 RepID=A0AAW0QYX1_9PEZI